MLLAEHVGQPLGLIAVGIVVTERREVVGHIHEHLSLYLHRFDVADVEQPVTVGSSAVGLQQLLVHQHGGGGGEPQIVVGHAAIAQVVVHAAAAASLLLGRIAHALHIAVVVVGPDERDVIRHKQSCIIDVECLLVRHEDLWQLRNLLLFMFR